MSLMKITMPKRKRIALIAHDKQKDMLIKWCETNKPMLLEHDLCGTGTTAKLIIEKVALDVFCYNSGPLGGDLQVASQVVDGKIDIIIFFSDPLTAQPHDPDVKALLRIAQVYDIPIANNKATADFLITSKFIHEEYEHKVIDFEKMVNRRVDDILAKEEAKAEAKAEEARRLTTNFIIKEV